MTAQVLSFLRRPAAPRDWSAQELAEFYRVESALIQAGLRVTAARGLTDEDEPWFVFCRAEDDDVIIHFARIDGRYVISAPAYCGNASGPDFRALVRSVIERQPVLQPRPNGNNLFLHPAALLVMLVASALLKSGHAAEATPAKAVADATEEKSRGVAPAATPTPATAATTAPEAQHETLILAAITAAIAPLVQAEPVTIVVSTSAHVPDFVDQPHERSVSPSLLDLPPDAAAQGAGSATPAVPLLQPIAALPAEATPSTLMHTVYQPDAALALVVPSAAVPTMQTALLSDALPIPTDPNAFVVAPDPATGDQHLSLSALSGIPTADLDFLHTLGVPGNVAYTATLPVALATVLQTGVHAGVSHTSVTPPAAEHASPAGNATAPSPAVAPVPYTTGPEAATHAATGSEAAAPAAAATGSEAAAPAATATGPEAATPAATAATATAAAPDMSAVLATVEQFQAVAIHPVVVITDHAAIFYDAAALASNSSAITSVTYNFGDGFSISLVGLPAELPHAGVHA